MNKLAKNILIVDSSYIICEGLLAIISNKKQGVKTCMANNISDLKQANIRFKADVILINPHIIQNQIKEFQHLKKEYDNTCWIAIVNSLFEASYLADFDEVIYIFDNPERINAVIDNLLTDSSLQNSNETPLQENLSEREIEVLKLLVMGNANKEIADKLNISAHTVISHRKNISQKTGIKSAAGLTIFAVVNNYISIDNYRN